MLKTDYLWTSKLKSGGRWLKRWEIRHRRRQTDHVTCVATGRMFTLCIAMRAKNYSERQNWRHQFSGQHERNKARSKRVLVAVGNCTRAMCVRARRCQSSSTESARCPPQRLYIPGQFVRWNRRVILFLQFWMCATVSIAVSHEWFLLHSTVTAVDVVNALKRQGHTLYGFGGQTTHQYHYKQVLFRTTHILTKKIRDLSCLKCKIGNLRCMKTTYASLLSSKTGSYVIVHCLSDYTVLYSHWCSVLAMSS